MLNLTIVRTVDFCGRHAWLVVLAAAVVALASGIYAARHFAITTDVTKLISAPSFADGQTRLNAFADENMLVVIEAPTPENADRASDKLFDALRIHPNVFRSVTQPTGGPFFERNGLLFLPVAQLQRTTAELTNARPVLAALASDPSLRGIADVLLFAASGARQGALKLDDLMPALNLGANTLEDVLAGRPASFSWRVLTQGRPARAEELRRLIQVKPILNYAALEPGKAASDAVRQAAAGQKLASDFDAQLLLTGRVPLDDGEYATIRRSAFIDIPVTIIAVLIVLWLALRSWRSIVSVAFALLVGLSATAAFGLLTVGTLNLISIAFAVLFIGIGVDFGLQFSVRYRSERHDIDDLRTALGRTAKKAGIPLALAAAATAAAFFSFLPTAFRGVSELGQIAGSGMLIALIGTLTVVPAALTLLKPPAEPHRMGFVRLAPVDAFMMRHRLPIVTLTIAAVALASPLLLRVQFDFNPLHLQNPNVPAVATFLKLQSDPAVGANAIEAHASSLDEANAVAQRFAALPEVSRALTVDSLIPDAQDQKLAVISDVARALEPAINPAIVRPAPTDAETVQALRSVAAGLSQAAEEEQGSGAAAARRLSASLTALSNAGPAIRAAAQKAFVESLRFDLDQLRLMLTPQRITLQSLPPDLTRNWVTSDGRAKVRVLPKGDPSDDAVLRSFAAAVLAVEPNATGEPVALQEAANIVVRAFIEAAALALISIALLLWITLRRIGDVLLTIVPLIVAGMVTLETCAVIGLPLNFANIIALPLLLGVGVAFKIYYIMAWRGGKTNLLESTLTRAVLFSAMTTGTAFGSLWLSSEPGLSSMGKLMALSLICTLAAAVLFQPLLMGPPRQSRAREDMRAVAMRLPRKTRT